jgi:hypothetical protein
MCPAPMIPIVVMSGPTAGRVQIFQLFGGNIPAIFRNMFCASLAARNPPRQADLLGCTGKAGQNGPRLPPIGGR